MAESVQQKLKRVRAPRVHITYDVETEGAQVRKELPFVVGVIGDFSGKPYEPLKPLKDRKFIQIDRDNFDDVMQRMTPGAEFKVDNTLAGDESQLAVQLKFKSMNDFEPGAVVQQVEPLRKLLAVRNKLRDLMSKVDRSEELESLLEEVLQNTEKLTALAGELGSEEKKGGSMSAELQKQPAAAPEESTGSLSLLDQAIQVTKTAEPDEMQDLLRTLTDEALAGTVTFSKNLTQTFNKAIEAIDQKLSQQLSQIMHHPDFQKLEGSWRGLNYLVKNSETSATLKIRVLNESKKELHKDLTKAVEFDQSQTFKKIYESEFGTPGGEPYGALIGDFEFGNGTEDLEILQGMSNIAAASFAPFISAASPKMFGLESFTELSKPRDLEKIFESSEYIKWRSFRDSDDSRFVTLTMPRVLARVPYGSQGRAIEEFKFEEAPIDANGVVSAMPQDKFSWMNASYALGERLNFAFAKYGWCVAIRGAEGGGKVEDLPSFTFTSDDGDADQQCPTEIGITDRREAELSKLGFLPLCHYKNTDYAVFFGAQTTQKPKKYDRPEATANAAISARLPYIMATSRFSHYLKVMGRDKIGSFLEASDCETWLNNWIRNYVNGNAEAGQEMKAQYPLAEAQVTVKEVPGAPGSYNAVAYLRPWLQMEELTASMRLVARIPQMG